MTDAVGRPVNTPKIGQALADERFHHRGSTATMRNIRA
jgi:hypothetical protein